MSSKNMTIKLGYIEKVGDDQQPRWEVIQVTDSCRFNPGQFLTKDEVRDLCELGMWKVTIVKGEPM